MTLPRPQPRKPFPSLRVCQKCGTRLMGRASGERVMLVEWCPKCEPASATTPDYHAEIAKLRSDLAQTQAEKEEWYRKYIDCPALDCPYERRMKEAEAALTRLSSERPDGETK